MNLFSSAKPMIMSFFMVFFSCNNDKLITSVSEMKDKDYAQVEIYCWCFLSNRYETVSPCTTTNSVTTAELIKKENLFRLISNRDTIERLKSVIFNDKKVIEEKRHYPDSRFIFLFKVNDSKADTINILSDSSLHYNNQYYFNYPFNVMDSIKIILDKNEIDCKYK